MHKLRCITALQTFRVHVISELQYPINHIAGYHLRMNFMECCRINFRHYLQPAFGYEKVGDAKCHSVFFPWCISFKNPRVGL